MWCSVVGQQKKVVVVVVQSLVAETNNRNMDCHVSGVEEALACAKVDKLQLDKVEITFIPSSGFRTSHLD